MWFAFVLAASVVLTGAFSKSELASAMPESGGVYIYMERTYGSLMGTISGLGLFASFMLKSAFALIGFAGLSRSGDGRPRCRSQPITMALVLLTFIVIINITGVKKIKKVQTPIVGTAVLFLLVLCIMALLSGDADLSKPVTNVDYFSPEMGSAAALVFVAYSGAIKVGAIGGEVMDPEKNIPRGMFASLLVATILYAGVAFVMVSVLPTGWHMDHGHAIENPIYVFAEHVAGSTVGVIAALLAIITMASMALAGVLSASRFLFAMARDNLLPSKLEDLNPTYETPHWPIVITGVLMATAILTIDVHAIAELASGFNIMVFVAINASVVVMRHAGPTTKWNPPYKSPLYPLPQIYGAGTGIILLWLIGINALIGAAGAIGLGVFVWLAYGRRHVLEEARVTPFAAFKATVQEPNARSHRTLSTRPSVPLTVGRKNHLTLSEFRSALVQGLGLDLTPMEVRTYFHNADENGRWSRRHR
jgi:amino acid transporter